MLVDERIAGRVHRCLRGPVPRSTRPSPLGREDTPQRASHPVDPGALPGGAFRPRGARRQGCCLLDAPASRPSLGRWRVGQGPSASCPSSEYAQRWVADTEAGIAHRGDPRYLEVRYEDLVQDPAAVLGGCSRTSARRSTRRSWWNPMPSRTRGAAPRGTAISTRSMGRWRTDLTPEEQALVQRIAGATLQPTRLPGRVRRQHATRRLHRRRGTCRVVTHTTEST